MNVAIDTQYETVPCNICGGTTFTTIYPAAPRTDHDLAVEFRSSGDEPLTEPVVACTACGLQFVNPRLNPQLILDGYREGTDPVFVSQAAAREKTFDRALARIETRVPGKGRLLDIGTAGGSFIHVAQRRGWTVDGCEPNKWLCEWGKKTYGLDIRPGTHFEQHYPDATFDVVTVWDVLEHAADPTAFLAECRRIMKPGGLLIVNYPDIDSWIAKVMGRRWPMLISVHLYFFTPKTLTDLLGRTGFDVVDIKPHYQWLELKYVFTRAEPLLGILARAARGVVSAVGLGHAHVPYWIGQTLVVARARSRS